MPRDLIALRFGAGGTCLVVEDDSLIRLDLQDTLRSIGVPLSLGAGSVAQALDLLSKNQISFSILDYQLRDGSSIKIAEQLMSAGTPFMFLTAYGNEIDVPPALAHIPVLSKPFTTELLAEAILLSLGTSASGE